MDISSLLGLIFAAVIFVGGAIMAVKNAANMFDLHGILIVGGGTLASALINYRGKDVMKLGWVFIKNVLGMDKIDHLGLIAEVSELSKAMAKGKKQFEARAQTVSQHPFLKEGCQILFWGESDISDEEIRNLLETRVATHRHAYNHKAGIFKNLGKFPPAFGLLGTVMGMIGIMESLNGDASLDNLGPSMSMAMVTTLYGIGFANLVLLPINGNLARKAEEDFLARKMIVEGLMLIHENKQARYIEEKLKSFLLPSERGNATK